MVNTSQTGNATNVPQPSATTPVFPTSATFFESYARLITLLLSIISVLGLFFGYFVKKSLTETEAEIENRFERRMDAWKEEREKLQTDYTSDAKRLQEMLLEVEKLEFRLQQALETWDDANRRYQANTPPASRAVDLASAAVDEQISAATTTLKHDIPSTPQQQTRPATAASSVAASVAAVLDESIASSTTPREQKPPGNLPEPLPPTAEGPK